MIDTINLIKSVIKNSFALLLVKILGPISSFILVVFIGRYLGASLLGKYIVAYNFYLIFYFISLLGLDSFIVREIAKDKTKASKYLVNIGFIGFVTSGLCFILICFIVYLMNYPVDIRVATYLINLALLPTMGIFLCEAVFIAFEKVKYFLFAIIAEVASKIFLGLLFLFLGYGINVLMIVIVMSNVLGLVTGLYFLFRYVVRPHLEIDFAFCREVLRETAPIFMLSIILYSILVRIDVVILSKVREATEVGWYGSASKFVWIGHIFIFSFIIAIFPIISKLFIISRDLFETICKKSLKYISILLLFIIIGTVLLSDKLILLFFGEKFMNSAIALKILIWSIFPTGWACFCGRILIATNKQKMDLYSLIVTLGFSLILTIFLSYKWGYVGTSIAVLISTTVWATLEYFFVHKYIFKLNIVQIVVKPFISTVITGAFMFLFREQMNLFILIIISSAIYLLLLFILKTFPKEDINLLERIVKNSVRTP